MSALKYRRIFQLACWYAEDAALMLTEYHLSEFQCGFRFAERQYKRGQNLAELAELAESVDISDWSAGVLQFIKEQHARIEKAMGDGFFPGA